MNRFVKQVNNTPIEKLEEYLGQIKLNKLEKLKLYLDDKYYNDGDSPVSDNRYDMIKDTLKKRKPGYVPPVGAKLRTGENRTKIPHWLGSADKITPEEEDVLQRWIRDNPADNYVFVEKLDGVSCLMEHKNGVTKLYTRGNGVVGADISYLAPYFGTIPKNLNVNISVRGELIMKKEAFEPYRRKGDVRGKLASGSKDYKNSRSMVSGLIGAKTARHGLPAIDFVAYEIVGDSMPKLSRQLKKLKKLGFTVAMWEKSDDLSMENLQESYLRMKETTSYEIDGMIVQADVPYDRNTSGNPSYMFAFKMPVGEAIRETTVKHIEWNVSKWGQLKPVAIIEPVQLDDITMKRLTAHNAKYVEDNKLGPGAVIKVTRSKEVIPYIVAVVKQAKKPQMPDVEYTWDANHVNVIVRHVEDIMCIKLISSFFAKLGIKHVSKATIKKMFANGLDNLMKILGASEARLLKVPEFQKRSAERIRTNIHNGLKDVKLSVVLGASGIFGFGLGRKRMDMLLLDLPNLLTMDQRMSKKQVMKSILNVEGFSEIMAQKVVDNIANARKFIEKISKYATFKHEERVSDGMKGHKYVMTGFRDKNLEEDIAARGGKVTSSVSKNTTAIIVAVKGGRLTGKLKKANDLGIPIYEKTDFIQQFIT